MLQVELDIANDRIDSLLKFVVNPEIREFSEEIENKEKLEGSRTWREQQLRMKRRSIHNLKLWIDEQKGKEHASEISKTV